MVPLAPRALLALAAASGTWLACVSEDPGPRASSTVTADGGRAVGDRLGACFPDGKCKEGLLCRDGEICLTPDEPKPVTDGGSSGSSGSSGTSTEDASSSTEAGTTDAGGTCTVPVYQAGPQCKPQPACASDQVCCKSGTAGDAVCTLAPACPAAVDIWSCERRTGLPCGGNQICCVYGPSSTAGSCGRKISAGKSRCTNEPECIAAGGSPVCTDGANCVPPKKCQPFNVDTSIGFSTVVRLCAP